MRKEIIDIDTDGSAALTAYLLDTGPGEKLPAVVILPGGAYKICSPRESEPVAEVYLMAGFHAFILHYSVGDDVAWPKPLDDYETATRYILDHAEEWGVKEDNIALVGFSAGGHLAAAAATMSDYRPDALILGYPVTRLETAVRCMRTAPDIVSLVDELTPPTFIFATRTDPSVPIADSLDFMEALNIHSIPFECHIYAFGPHGFSTGDPFIGDFETPLCERARDWPADSIGWLKEIFGINTL